MNASFVLSLIVIVAASQSFVTTSPVQLRNGTVYMRGRKFVFNEGIMDKSGGAAFGSYNDSVLLTGWSSLEVISGRQSHLTDGQRAFAIGYLEGALTAREIVTNAANMKQFWKASNPKFNAVFKWLQKQDDWARAFVQQNPQDPVARVTGYVLSQADGLIKGVQDQVGSNNFTQLDFFVLANGGDLIELTHFLMQEKVDLMSMSTTELRQYIALRGRCSALVKMTPGYENIIMSHATWFTYSATLRIFKHYQLELVDPAVVTGKMSFSGYPGVLSSLDAFYVLGSQMVMLQTTNIIFNDSLYNAIHPSSLTAWQRVRIANHLSSSGKEWGYFFSKHNSGTYNNQYMLIDLKRVHLKNRIDDGTLTIVEQIPGLVVDSDQTPILRNGHWPSYNVPFHEVIYNLSGYPEFVQKHGLDFSYQLAPRAKLFRRDADTVRSVEDMQRLMRSNNYTKDPYSQGDPTSAICARGDLVAKRPTPMGCIDGKVTDYKMALKSQATAINGPTRAGGNLPPFSWRSSKFLKFPHLGLPMFYNFTWQSMEPFH